MLNYFLKINMQRMLYNYDFVCIIILPAEKNRFPHTISLFFPHDFEIVCFDTFTLY